jgi:hypothetical protein
VALTGVRRRDQVGVSVCRCPADERVAKVMAEGVVPAIRAGVANPLATPA